MDNKYDSIEGNNSSNNFNSDIDKQIIEVLDLIRPYIQGDGGDVEYLGFDDGIVRIKMLGACVGCGMADFTIYNGIEKSLIEEVPGVKGIKLIES